MYTDTSSSAFIRRMKARTLVGARALNPGLVPGRNSDATGAYITGLDTGRRTEVIPELEEAVANLYSTVPDAPTGVSAVAGIRQAIVSFVAPLNDGRTPITEYTVTSTPGGIVATGTASPITVTGLANGTAYTFTAVATNKMGDSVASEPSASVTTFNVPSAPTNLIATAGNGQVTISFTAPADGGSPITNYKYSTNGGTSYSSFSPADISSPVTITGLTNGQTYNIGLLAINAVGDGIPSSIILVSTATVPSPPTGVSAVPGDGQATVYFTPSVSDGGSPIIGYMVSTPDNITAPGSSSPITISGLTNGRPYTFRVTATNSVGTSVQSTASVAVTPSGVPAPPTNLSGVGGDKALYILFTAGSNGGSPITNYEYSTDGGTTFTACNPAQISSPISISDPTLVNGTPYTVALKAVNAAGASIASATVVVTPTVNTLTQDSNRLIELDASNASSYAGSGTTWTNLQSGGLYSATLVGGPIYNASTNGGVITCDGTNDYIEIADAAAIRATVGGAITAQIWAKVDPSLNSGDGLISKQYGGGSGKDYDGFRLSVNTDGSFTFGANGQATNDTHISPPNKYSTGVWALYTLVFQFNQKSINTVVQQNYKPSYVYVSPYSVYSAKYADNSIPNNAPLRLAQGIQDGGNFCPCDIGAFYYYNTALSQEDIIRNYDATKSRFGL